MDGVKNGVADRLGGAGVKHTPKVGRGVIYLHSAPAALCPHIEWALGSVLQTKVKVDWTAQPAQPGSLRAELLWHGPSGSSAALASALRACRQARFEVTEDAIDGEGHRYSFTPQLGLFHASTDAAGNIVVTENRLNALIAEVPTSQLADGIAELLGRPWDEELEVFRQAQADYSVRWLTRAG